MQRTLLIALAAAVLAAGIATTATIVLTGGDDDDVAALSPSPEATLTPAATAEVETPSPTPGASATDDGGDEATTPPQPTVSPTTKPGVTIRSAKSVDCDDEPKFCSSSDEMQVTDDNLDGSLDEGSDPKSTTRPTVAMDSHVWGPGKQDASDGEDVASIHVEVLVSNGSEDTFVFAKREIVLEIFRNGKLYDSFGTTGAGFELAPGAKMSGTFDRPITQDGTYTWQAKVWYYEK